MEATLFASKSIINISLIIKKRFMLDEMTWENHFKTTQRFFFISCYFIFSQMNALVYVDIDPRAFIRGKIN